MRSFKEKRVIRSGYTNKGDLVTYPTDPVIETFKQKAPLLGYMLN